MRRRTVDATRDRSGEIPWNQKEGAYLPLSRHENHQKASDSPIKNMVLCTIAPLAQSP